MGAALALARRGHEVTLLEAFAAPRPLGSGLLLQPTGLKALSTLGLEDTIRAAGARIDRLDGRDLTGRKVLDVDYADWRKGGHGIGIHRAALFDALHQAMPAAGVTLITGARIIGASDGFDSSGQQSKIMLPMMSSFNEVFIDQLKAKVHRG